MFKSTSLASPMETLALVKKSLIYKQKRQPRFYHLHSQFVMPTVLKLIFILNNIDTMEQASHISPQITC